MEERGKLGLDEFSYCKKHPYSSAAGICAYCLKDRLVNLVCSDCGEQRVSSCSCSDVSSSHRNSCSTTMEAGSVGRVSSFLNQKVVENIVPPAKEAKPERVIFLRRSSSSCVEVKKTNGFWKIKRMFRKRKGKQGFEENDGGSEIWAADVDGGNNFSDVYDDDYRFSSAKISDVNGGVFLDYDKQYAGAESELLRRVKSLSKSDFITAMEESSFIDLKLELSDKMKQEIPSSGPRISSCSDDHGFGFFKSDVISLNESSLKRNSSSSRRHHSVWKWISKYHPRKGLRSNIAS